MPPKNIELRQFTYAKPPRKRPTARFARSMILSEMPPAPMISPIRMKNGMESSEKLLTPSTIWRTSAEKFVPVTSAQPSVESSIAKDTGTRSSISAIKPPMSTIAARVAVVICVQPPSFPFL